MHILTASSSTLIRELQSVIQDLSSSKQNKHKPEGGTYTERRDLPKPFPLDIPLPPMELDQADYPDAKYWTLEDWQEYTNNANGEANSSKLGFLCNEDGDPVNKARLRVMMDMAKKLWSDLYRYRFDPVTWRFVGKAADEYFCNNMRVSFPEFTLCAENWKVKVFATIRYPDWSIGTRGTGRLSSSTYFVLAFSLVPMHILLGAVPSIKNNGNGMSLGPSKRLQEDDKENERDGTRDKRPHLQESVTTTTDATTSNNTKPISTSKRTRLQPRFKARSKTHVKNTDLATSSPPISPPAPVMMPEPGVVLQASIDTPSTVQTSSMTMTAQTPAVNAVPTPFAQVPTKTSTSVVPISAQASVINPLVATTLAQAHVITPMSIPTTPIQPLDIQMQDPSSGVSADALTMAPPTTVTIATSGPTRELDVEMSQGAAASMTLVPVASGIESLAPDGTSVSIATFIEILLTMILGLPS